MSLIAHNDWTGELGVTASQNALRALSKDIEACSDLTELDCLMLSHKTLMRQAFEHNEQWFDQMKRIENQKRRELTAQLREKRSYGIDC